MQQGCKRGAISKHTKNVQNRPKRVSARKNALPNEAKKHTQNQAKKPTSGRVQSERVQKRAISKSCKNRAQLGEPVLILRATLKRTLNHLYSGLSLEQWPCHATFTVAPSMPLVQWPCRLYSGPLPCHLYSGRHFHTGPPTQQKKRSMPKSCKTTHTEQMSCKNHAMQNHAKPCNSPRPLPASIPGENARPTQKNWPRKKKNGKLGETTTADRGGRGRRRPGSHGGGWCRCAEPAAQPGSLRAALARGRAADPRASATTPTWACGLPARTSTTTSLIREGPNDFILLRNGQKKLVLPARRRAPADQAGQGLLPRQVLRVPGPCASDHPWQAAQGAERGCGPRAQGLAAGERAGRHHDKAPGTPHGEAGGAAGQATSGGLAGPGRPHPAALRQDLLP